MLGVYKKIMKVFKYNIDTLAEWNKKPHPYYKAVASVIWLLFGLIYYFDNKFILAGMGVVLSILSVKEAVQDARTIKERGNAVVEKNT